MFPAVDCTVTLVQVEPLYEWTVRREHTTRVTSVTHAVATAGVSDLPSWYQMLRQPMLPLPL
jgi:hypothetical protein